MSILNDTATAIADIPLNKIKLNRNSRLDIRAEELHGLMQSIKEEGLLQPIGVMRSDDGYEICYGNRRFLACSKLGKTTIPAMIHHKTKDSDLDIKNLTENIQRRNISVVEQGRHMAGLLGQGLSKKEIAVRLGVEDSYVKNCFTAFNDVPKEHQDDVIVSSGAEKRIGKKRSAGKITIGAVNAIRNAKKSYGLSAAQAELLYSAAKSRDEFRIESVPQYAAAIKGGKKDFIADSASLRSIHMRFSLSDREFKRINRDYIDNGIFPTTTALFRSILRAEKSIKVNLL